VTPARGRNKQLRSRIAGQERVISRHETKIEEELRKPSPDQGYLKKWQQEIDVARENVRS
jgi:hypothetical protein